MNACHWAEAGEAASASAKAAAKTLHVLMLAPRSRRDPIVPVMGAGAHPRDSPSFSDEIARQPFDNLSLDRVPFWDSVVGKISRNINNLVLVRAECKLKTPH